MINFQQHTLANGLRLVVHEDRTTPLVAINMLYDVGSKDENPERTGFAHLFEHLMFGGSKNAPSYDDPIQMAGGESNAFTNSDITNFFCLLPSQNVDLGLFLEADRMANLVLDEQALAVQQDVVIEEFKETCLNQPYGDLWHVLAALAYRVHPYQWPTIGKTFDHIAGTTLDDVAKFYQSFYGPDNAICIIAGNIGFDQAVEKVEAHFSELPSRNRPVRKLAQEPEQSAFVFEKVKREVPVDALYMAFHMPARVDDDYCKVDLLSDVLGQGKSSRLFSRFVKKKNLCTAIDAYVTGSFDPGLFIIEAKPSPGKTLKEIETAIWDEINDISSNGISDIELERQKNKLESGTRFTNINILNKAIGLAQFALMGDPNLINTELDLYNAVSAEDVRAASSVFLTQQNCTCLHYMSSNKS